MLFETFYDGLTATQGKPEQRAIGRVHPDALQRIAATFPSGSMGPKVSAACEFVKKTGRNAGIGGLTSIDEMLAGQRGTIVTTAVEGSEFRAPSSMAA